MYRPIFLVKTAIEKRDSSVVFPTRARRPATRARWNLVVPMLVRSRAARCLARSALNPPRRQLCGGDFALKNAFVTMQLHPGATTKQIKAKFYELAKATHPYATQGSNRLSERTRCVTPHLAVPRQR